MSEQKQIEIYFHVGMGKVASKYLQYVFFPSLKKIHYIQTRKYHQYASLLKNGKESSYLISREFDQQLEREVIKFGKEFPNAKTILLLRRHDSWIASQYRRFAKNGFYDTFEKFIDLRNDSGKFKLQDLNFYKNIEILENTFTSKPLVLFYDDFIQSPIRFLHQIATYTNSTFDKNKITLKKTHVSYDEKQIKWMQLVSKKIGRLNYSLSKNKTIFFFQRIPIILWRYLILKSAFLIPQNIISKNPLINADYLNEIKTMTENDWVKCKAYAKANNPIMPSL